MRPATTRRRAAASTDPFRETRRLALAAVAATLLLIAMGGLVRATDSGLACPDWPACYGRWIPPADLAMWLEHSHRLWAGVVLALIGALAVRAALRHRDAPWVWRLSVAAFVLTLVQAGLGAAVVLALLPGGLVATHLATSFLVLAALVTVAVLARGSSHHGVVSPTRARWSLTVAALVFGQAILGSWGTGQGIAYVFNAVPFWSAGEVWTASTREVAHLVHRGSGYAVAAAVVLLALRWRRTGRHGHPAWVVRLPAAAVALVLVQVALGLTTALTRGDELPAAAHLTVGSWLWLVVVTIAAVDLAPRLSAGPRSLVRETAIEEPR